MMVVEETLPAELQSLIDARLDTIDRMLLGRVPRADRTAITREVESQIHDLLAERGGGDVDRDLVLSALARLDPPEAYLTDELAGDPTTNRRPASPRPFAPVRAKSSTIGLASGIVGLSALGFVVLASVLLTLAYLGTFEEAIYLFLGVAGIAFLIGIVSLTLAFCDRVASHWSIVGLTTGLISAVVSPAAILFVFLVG